MTIPGVCFRQATLDEIYRLRFAALRPGQPVERVHFAGDDAPWPTTMHFGAFSGQRNLACVTLLPGEWQGAPAYQLRGMAVEEAYRSQGLGCELLHLAERRVLEQTAIRLLWCNARVAALRFYERNGWRTVSDVFHIAGVGDHHKMIRQLDEFSDCRPAIDGT